MGSNIGGFQQKTKGSGCAMVFMLPIVVGALLASMACGASRATNTIGNLAVAPSPDSGSYKSSKTVSSSEFVKDSAGGKVTVKSRSEVTEKSRVAVSADAREQAIDAIGTIGVQHEKASANTCWTCSYGYGGYMQPIVAYNGMSIIRQGGQNIVGDARVGVGNVGTRGGGGGINVIVRTP